MSRKKLVSIATMLVLAMMLTACNGTPSQGEVNNPSSSVKPSESDKPDSQLPSESEDSSELDSSLEGGATSLTENEVEWFNEQFFNVDGNAIVNAFLNCTYTDVKDISMYDLFYDCPNQSEVDITDAELTLLEQEWEEIYTDVQKVPVSYIDDMFSKYANIKFADTNKVDLEEWVYLAGYNAYYGMHGDTHYSPVEVQSGVKDDSGNIILSCYRSEDEKTYQVTLKPHDNGYYFVSNLEIQ